MPLCQQKPPADHPSGQLSVGAHVSQQTLLQPLVSMQYAARLGAARPRYSRARAAAADVVLAAANAHVSTQKKDGTVVQGMGMTFQRVHLDTCYGNQEVTKWYPIGDGVVQLSEIFDVAPDQVFDSSLTFIHVKEKVPEGVLTLCPMEIRSVFINKTLKHG